MKRTLLTLAGAALLAVSLSGCASLSLFTTHKHYEHDTAFEKRVESLEGRVESLERRAEALERKTKAD